jgi:hypothetical protein
VRITAMVKNGVSSTRNKKLFGDGGDLASGLGSRRGGPGRAVDQGHLPKNASGRERLHDFAITLDLDLARADHVHLVALAALGEDDVARSERCGWEARIGKKLEIDCSDRHARYTSPCRGQALMENYDSAKTVV